MFDDLSSTKVLVVGDAVIDRYEWAVSNRLSREAPIPVVDVQDRTDRLGGAGNVAANAAALGCPTSLVTFLGKDADSDSFRKSMSDAGIIDCTLKLEDHHPTIKSRFMVNSQQVSRIDYTNFEYVNGLSDRIFRHIVHLMYDTDVIIIANPAFLLRFPVATTQILIQMCREAGLPVFVDPHVSDWTSYAGAACVTPNIIELSEAYGRPVDKNNLEEAAQYLLDVFALYSLLVTMGPEGMGFFTPKDSPIIIPTDAREVYDVSGAGDTTIAVMASLFGSRVEETKAAMIANIAAGIVVEKLGTCTVTIDEIKDRIRDPDFHPSSLTLRKVKARRDAITYVHRWRQNEHKIIFTNGCFDLLHPGHISLIHEAKRLGGKLVVGLNTDASIHRLKGEGRPVLCGRDRASMLFALEDVDLIVFFDEDTPKNLVRELKPDIWVKGANYKKEEIPGYEIVESYGGKIHLAEIVPGYSTTGMIGQIKLSGTER